jgi:sulfur relay (sulfurtransferase) DsrC/TusE family protein
MEKRVAVISFLQEYYGKHKKIPSTATLFKSFNKTRAPKAPANDESRMDYSIESTS